MARAMIGRMLVSARTDIRPSQPRTQMLRGFTNLQQGKRPGCKLV